MARLVWTRKDEDAKEFALGDAAVIGREEGADCRLERKSVSRRHARIVRRDPDWFIADLGSMNGTLVNGSRLEAETRLQDGDEIRVGEEALRFEAGEAGPAPTRGSLVTEPLSRTLQGRLDGGAAPASNGEALPRRLGKFYLLRKLGQGGMGVVYRALDLDSNREVAVKFIRADIGRNEAFLDFFHTREAVLAREIQHPNVITVFEHGVGADQHYISMEYVPGENLYQVGKRRRLAPTEALEIVRQIACGLAAAHRRGVVHSDVKPANVLVLSGDDTTWGGASRPADVDGIDKDASRILEFEGESPPADAGTSRYDPDLMAEIRKRVGAPARDVVLDPPWFPRVSESGFLGHYLEKARGGKGCFVLVQGDVGTGKDRLISEFLRENECGAPDLAASGARPEGGLTSYEYDCSRIEGILLLWEQVFERRPLVQTTSKQMLAEIVRSFEEDPRPRVLRILNLGSANQLACDLLLVCARLMESQGLLLVASIEPEDPSRNASLKPLLERISLVVKELYLRPLTEYQVQRYMDRLFPDVFRDGKLGTDLYRLSRGNFARLLEIVRSFFDRGILSLDTPSGRLHYRPRAQEFELEEGKDLYERYRKYGRIEQRVVEQAAFIGPRFLFETLLRLNEIDETALFFIVRTLVADGFLVEEQRGWYALTNSAFQRYLADRVPASERPHLHRKIARLLDSAPVATSAELFQLKARHLAGCREHSRAVQQLLQGAYLARNEYREDLFREMFQEILRIYRSLASQDKVRKEVTDVLRSWLRRDGNWYEILGELVLDVPRPLVKITDFGISFRMKDEERGYQVEKRPVLGTPRYMAPERTKGEYGGFKSDIFALGVMSYELAAGRPPFPDLKGPEVIEANRAREIALAPEELARFPAGMEQLLAGMLEKDPSRRWDAERVIQEITKMQLEARSGR